MAVSEPHLLFSIMDRHTDWAVMICLVGLGQDIYDGEVGINEWFRCGVQDFEKWEMYYSSEIFSQVEDKGINKQMIEGMVIFVPQGVDPEADPTRDHAYYDSIFAYLKQCGIRELD